MDVLWPWGVTTYFKAICGCLSLLAQEVHGTKESCPSLGLMFSAGVHVLSLPPNGFFYLFWNKLSFLHCRPQPVSPLLHAISKDVAFFCVNWLSSDFLQPFLCIPVAPPASCCLHILQPNTVCRPNYASLYPVQWHCSCQHKKIQGIHKEPLQ